MDAHDLYPGGYHPIDPNKSLDMRGAAKHFTRTQRPPKYYLIDFGLSRQYKPEERPPSEPIVRGGDKSPPEHKTLDIPCDPFPTDVYYLGNLIREEFLQVSKILPNSIINTHSANDPLEEAWVRVYGASRPGHGSG